MGRRHGWLLVSAILLGAGLAPARAVGSPPAPVLIQDQVRDSDPIIASGVCVFELPLSNTSISFSPDVQTSAATLVRPSNCVSCPNPSILLLNSVSFRVLWPLACGATVEITVVESSGGACPAPLTDRVVCGPITHTISGTAGARVIHTLAMPPGCCISRDAFVLLKFIGFDQCINVNGLAPTLVLANNFGSCVPCTQYASVSNIYPPMTEWCSIINTPLWISVDANCCDPTPTLPNSWGRLKTLYR
jgi:hypothetical protein